MYFAFKRKIEENDFEIKHKLQTDKKKTKKKERRARRRSDMKGGNNPPLARHDNRTSVDWLPVPIRASPEVHICFQAFSPLLLWGWSGGAWGGRVVRWCWANFQYRGVLLIWIRVGQVPSVLAVGAGGACLDIFSLYHFSFFLPLSLGDGPIWTEILSQRAVKPKKTKPNQTGWCEGAG